MIRRILARSSTTVSSSVAIGTASLFVAVAAMVGLALDRPLPFASSWSLRGTIGPGADAAAPGVPARGAPQRRAKSRDPLDYA